jgi:hypothetical protein
VGIVTPVPGLIRRHSGVYITERVGVPAESWVDLLVSCDRTVGFRQVFVIVS